MSNIGYARVSSNEQNVERQIVNLGQFEIDRMFIDKCSGATAERVELKKMLEYIREGDTVIVDEISRFARSTSDLLHLVEVLNNKGVQLRSLKENIDTHSPSGIFMLTLFGAIAALERDYIKQRQREGIELAKEKGIYKGRPIKQVDKIDEYIEMVRNHQITVTKACDELQISRATWYRRFNEKVNSIDNV